MDAIVPARAVNVALLAPVGIWTVDGVLSTALSSETDTAVPPAETLLSATVQVAV